MGQITLSKQDIALDIHQYHERIRSCRDRLAALPPAERQTPKHQAARRVIGSEIDHVFRMVDYAKQALDRL